MGVWGGFTLGSKMKGTPKSRNPMGWESIFWTQRVSTKVDGP